VRYHGGIDDSSREEAQNRFSQNDCDVVVATNAFGMGIDRPDLRFVVHFDIPGSLEAYYQEAGRAGRDGEPAECELLFNYADTRVQEFFIEGSNPSIDLIRQVFLLLKTVADDKGEVVMSLKDLAARLDNESNEMAVHSAVTILDRHGLVDRYDIPGKRIRGTRVLQPNLGPFDLPIDVRVLQEKEKRDRAKLKAMIDYAYGRECRQTAFLRYFGDPEIRNCGACDRCSSQRSKWLRAPTEEEKIIVRKALSGVARMSVRGSNGFLPRFGRNRVIQVLLGSQTKEILDARLNELSTYGILKQSSTKYLQELFRELEEEQLIQSTGGQYPMITLTERGIAVMQDRVPYQLVWPKQTKPRSKHDLGLSVDLPFDQGLFETLQKVRAAVARENGNVPSYVIFPDETLKAFARLKPDSIVAARRIRGVGEIKAKKYLPVFLSAIAKFAQAPTSGIDTQE
jgi:ATP-dependent DNA helicase RecQ